MPSVDSKRCDIDGDSRLIARKTALILLAVAFNAIEFFIPRIPFFPWLKPGLANCVTILWIVEFGALDALLFSLIRIWIAGFYFGFSFYTVSLGLSGALCSTLAMGLAWKTAGQRGWMGSVGIGVIGALAHNLTQIAVIYLLLAKNVHLFYQVPLMFGASVVFGSVTGALAPILRGLLDEAPRGEATSRLTLSSDGGQSFRRDAVISVLLFFAGCGVALINDPRALATCAGASTLFVFFLHRASPTILLWPLSRFWLMFLFIGCIHGFLSYGTRIEVFPLVTYEGARLTGVQWLKLWTWLELSFLLTRFNFHRVVLALLRGLFPNNRTSLAAGITALELFPLIVEKVQKKTMRQILRCVIHPVMGMRRSFTFVCREIEELLVLRRETSGDR